MVDKTKAKTTPASKREGSLKDIRYNAKRIPLFRVEIVPSDNAELLKKIKADLLAKSGNPKTGVIELYQFAKENGYFDE